ncbi:extracellular solute-binding protein [Haloimpatiens sp. FM7330]|uniref:extracellular solute-binding protein n=1 Tax=Haloimpatiens sp. FM7330 TaxID=3298610 RepID=UPI003628C9F9
MRKKSIRFMVCSLITVILLVVSVIYRISINEDIKLSASGDKNVSNDPKLKGKTIVRVWIRKDSVSSTRAYQVEKFNEENDDVYIMLSEYKQDYDNLTKTALAAEKGPDIMTYAFFEMIKDGQISNLEKAGVNLNKIGKENLVYYNGEPFGTRMIENNVKFIWNKDIFKKAGLDPNKPPKTFKQLIEYCEKIKKIDPDIIPFQFPLNSYQDFKLSIGEPSVNLGNIYTTFWDYKNGNYDFNYAQNILSVYNELYFKGLLDKDFDKKSRKQLRTDFYKGKSAMMLSTFEDKGYFSNIIPLSFDTGIANLPKVHDEDDNKQYFLANSNFLCINNKITEKSDKEKKAVLQVYEWLTSQEPNKEILKTRMAILPLVKDTKVESDIYKEYNNVNNFKTEAYDPSIFISRNSSQTVQLCVETIKGDKQIRQAIDELNKSYVEACNISNKYRVLDLKSYTK